MLRVPPKVHAALRQAAAERNTSLNDYCLARLTAPTTNAEIPGAADAVRRAAELAGAALVGVVVFGSWSRGTASDRSDVDLLIVVDPTFPLTRDAYRDWDKLPVVIDGRPAEPHLVRFPPPATRMAGLWAEVAIDGIVLFDRGLAVSRRLAEIRRAIAERRLERRTTHGQGYWFERES